MALEGNLVICYRRSHRWGVQLPWLLWLALLSSAASARPLQETGQPPSHEVPAADDAPVASVAATVDDVPIYVAEVDRRVRQSLGDRDATDQAMSLLRAEALEQLIQRQMALAYLQQRGEACNEQEIDLAMSRLKEELARQEKSIDDYCRAEGIPQPALRQDMRWQLSWKRYVDKYLTDENLQRYFERHHQHFDGTRLRVAQILLRVNANQHSPEQKPAEPSRTAGQERELLQRAEQIREEITSNKITFADAARKYSQSPSGRDGGQLDWIERTGPMPEFFARAAFDLEVGEVSQPLISPLGST